MKAFCIFFVTATLGCHFTLGAEILRGYMVSKDGSKCIETTSVVLDSSGAAATAAGLSGAMCTLMSVQDGSGAGQYIIEEQGDNTKQVTLTANAATTFTNAGTQLVFIPESTTTALTGITSADVSLLTTVSTAVYVANVNDQTDNTDCLKLDGDYNQASDASVCANQLWYFVTAACTGTGCAACNPDPALCSECAADASVNTAGDTCVACNGVTDCLVCTLDGSDNIVCSSCDSSKTPTASGDGCFTCSDAECATCSADDVCATCTDGAKEVSSDSSTCVTCSDAECATCSADDVCATCTDGAKELSSDSSTCVTCSDGDCETCSADDECAVCTDATKKPTSDGSACITCTVADCLSCDTADVCVSCDGTKHPNATGSECLECSDFITDCDDCTVSAGEATCTTCGNSKEPDTDGSSCVTTTTTTTESKAVLNRISLLAVTGLAFVLFIII